MGEADYGKHAARSDWHKLSLLINHSLMKWIYPEITNLDSFEVGQVLLNLATQLGGNLKDSVVVLHHEGHQLCGEQLVQVHLIDRAKDAVRKHLHHLNREHDRRKIRDWKHGTVNNYTYNMSHVRYVLCVRCEIHINNKHKICFLYCYSSCTAFWLILV